MDIKVVINEFDQFYHIPTTFIQLPQVCYITEHTNKNIWTPNVWYLRYNNLILLNFYLLIFDIIYKLYVLRRSPYF